MFEDRSNLDRTGKVPLQGPEAEEYMVAVDWARRLLKPLWTIDDVQRVCRSWAAGGGVGVFVDDVVTRSDATSSSDRPFSCFQEAGHWTLQRGDLLA